MNQPPSDDEKFSYAQTNKLGFYIPSLLSTSILLIGVVFFSLSHPSLWWYLGYVVILLIYLSLSFAVGVLSDPFDEMGYRFRERSHKPNIDIFLPSCGESIEVIKNTIQHAIEMAKHYGPAKVYVLDDASNSKLTQWCIENKIHYIARPTHELKKAGNLRNAFSITKGEWILVLDADFVSRRDMLNEMVNQIDPWVAIIQTPQFFRVEKSMNRVEKGAGFVQELFYRLIQVNRNHFGAPVCVGTCALYRRKALEPFGGTAPIDYSEDLHTGFMVMEAGWGVRYLPINLAAGECPKEIKSFFSQQYRWCMGSITLLTNKNFWLAKKIDWVQKACFLTGMLYYVATALSVILTAVPSIIVLLFFPELAHWYSFLFSLPSLLVGTLVIALWSKRPFGLYAIESRIISYWAHLFAIVDKLRGNLMPWVPTGAGLKVSRYLSFRYLFSAYTITLSSFLILGVYQNYENQEVYPMVLITSFYRCLDLKIIKHLWLNEA